jgi:hypothetical protein
MTEVAVSLRLGGGPLESEGCHCPWEALGPGEYRAYHVIDCDYLHKIRTSDPMIRDLGDRVRQGLMIMRDPDDDSDDWLLPDLAVVAQAISALGNLVQHAEDRHRFKIALQRIGKEWTDENASADDVRQFARSVVAGGTARAPLSAAKSETPGE